MTFRFSRAFSLIELLVSLSIIAMIAAIIVPRFVGVGEQAQQAVIDHNLSEISHAAAMWQSLGGTYDASETVANSLGAFHLIEFLSTPSNGYPDRGMRGLKPGSTPIDPTNTFTDSPDSASVVIAAYVAAPGTRPANNLPDGYYSNRNATGSIYAARSPARRSRRSQHWAR